MLLITWHYHCIFIILFILVYHVILWPSYGIRQYAITPTPTNINNIISSIRSIYYVSELM